MRKYLTIALLLLTFTIQAQDLNSLFIAMPDTLSPLLTTVNRQDFGDFLQSGMKAQVKNRFLQTSEMMKLTDDYLELQLTSVSRLEMRLLGVDDSTRVICVAKTYQGPVSDTELTFYSTEWEKLPTMQYIQLPQKDDFFIKTVAEEKRDSLELLKKQADMYLVKAQLAEKEETLTFTYTVPDYMEKESAAALRKFLLQDPLVYQWQKGRFVVKISEK